MRLTKTVKCISALVAALMLLCLIPVQKVSGADDSRASVSVCEYSKSTDSVTVSGTVNHRLVSEKKDGEILLYLIRPWESAEEAVINREPAASAPVSLRFEFTVACESVADRLSMFAVYLKTGSGAELLSVPVYTSVSTGQLSAAFKGVAGASASDAANLGAGSCETDIYIERLLSSGRSGYYFSPDNGKTSYYFDRSETDSIEKAVTCLTACGADIFLRFMSSDGSQASGAQPFFAVRSDSELEMLYSCVYFILARIGGQCTVKGITFGRGDALASCYCGSNCPEDLPENYAALLCAAATAVSDSAGSSGTALLIPFSDGVDPDGNCVFAGFAGRCADFINLHSSLTVTFRFESVHNPCALNDEYFMTDPDSGEKDDNDPSVDAETTSGDEITSEEAAAGETVTAETSAGETAPEESVCDTPIAEETTQYDITDTQASAEDSAAVITAGEDTVSAETSPEESFPEETAATDASETAAEEHGYPVPNADGCGYWCSDNPEAALSFLSAIAKSNRSVSSKYMWVWYPGADTVTSAGVLYAYNYMRTAALGASVFMLSLEDAGDGTANRMNHLVKYINTAESDAVTSFALSVFGAEGWEELCGKISRDIITETLYDMPLQVSDGRAAGAGRVTFWDFASQGSTLGWYDGFGCSSVRSVSGSSGRGMRAEMQGSGYSDTGVICGTPELLLYSDSLELYLRCGAEKGSIYEIKVFINAGDMKIEASGAVESGTDTYLYLDTSGLPADAEISSLRIAARPVTGTDTYSMMIYSVGAVSSEYTSAELQGLLKKAKKELMTDSADTEADKKLSALIAAGAVFFASAVFIVAAVAADKYRNGRSENQEG